MDLFTWHSTALLQEFFMAQEDEQSLEIRSL